MRGSDGNIYQSAPSGVTLVTKDGAGTQTGTVSASGLVTLNAGDHLDMASGDNGRLRWGWATNGTLARTQLVPPALPTTSTPPGSPAPSLPRQFYRVAIVDTTWALLGNPTGSAVLGIAGDDQMIPSDVQPMVRDQVVIDYLVDGPDTLAAASAVLARTPQDMILAVSPVLDGTISVPTHVGVNAHWPAFPASSSTAPFPSPPASVKDGITAAWTAGNDVVVTIAADKAPDGAHIRIYPQQFVTIPAITQEPSFRRGDGGAAIAQAGHATLVLLPNPFAPASGQPRPNPANLTMDVVVVPRQGTRKMWGAVSVPVASGPAAPPSDPFAGINGVAAMPAMFESVAPDPLFGIPTTVTPPGAAPSNVIQFGRALASETAPRQGPRLPTMGRLETILATGLSAGAGNPDLWEAVLTGGR